MTKYLLLWKDLKRFWYLKWQKQEHWRCQIKNLKKRNQKRQNLRLPAGSKFCISKNNQFFLIQFWRFDCFCFFHFFISYANLDFDLREVCFRNRSILVFPFLLHHTNSSTSGRGNVPIRAPRAPTTAPKQPDIAPKIIHFSYHVFKQLKWCHATTFPHTSHICIHHNNWSISGWGNFPIQAPWGPHHSPETARHTHKITRFPIMFSSR